MKMPLTKAIEALGRFIGPAQLATMKQLTRGEEGQFFKDKFVEYAERVSAMPHTGQTEGQGEKAVVQLHYFLGGCDWYITEKDIEAEQLQAFGWADLGYGGEWGYINIEELQANGVELDLHWKPRPLAEIRRAA